MGGESGPHARPMHIAWARSLRDQCVQADVPFFFKQWGEWLPVDEDAMRDEPGRFVRLDRNGVDLSDLPGLWSEEDAVLKRVGRGKAGRVLDGKVWDQRPEA